MRRTLDFVKHARAQFGEYIEADWHDSPSNTMKARTYPAIYLGPTGNIQGTINPFDPDRPPNFYLHMTFFRP